jgi:hypothetical protein
MEKVINNTIPVKFIFISTSLTEAAPGGVEVIVLAAFIGVAKHFVSLADFLELVFGILVALVSIGMILAGELPVSLFYFVGCGFFINT